MLWKQVIYDHAVSFLSLNVRFNGAGGIKNHTLLACLHISWCLYEAKQNKNCVSDNGLKNFR